MSCCISPTKAKDLFLCIETLNIGVLASGSVGANLTVYFKNVATGNIQSINTISLALGAISVDMETILPMKDHEYQIRVTLQDDDYSDVELLDILDAAGVLQSDIEVFSTTFRMGELATQNVIIC